MQASRLKRLLFDPFSLFQNNFVLSEVDIGRCDVVEALVETQMVVVIDEGRDLRLEVAGQEVVFQQDAVLEGLMSAFDLALGLRMIWRTARVLYPIVLQPFGQIT